MLKKYKNMKKSMVEFLSKFKSCGNKIAQVNSIRITTSKGKEIDRCSDANWANLSGTVKYILLNQI